MGKHQLFFVTAPEGIRISTLNFCAVLILALCEFWKPWGHWWVLTLSRRMSTKGILYGECHTPLGHVSSDSRSPSLCLCLQQCECLLPRFPCDVDLFNVSPIHYYPLYTGSFHQLSFDLLSPWITVYSNADSLQFTTCESCIHIVASDSAVVFTAIPAWAFDAVQSSTVQTSTFYNLQLRLKKEQKTPKRSEKFFPFFGLLRIPVGWYSLFMSDACKYVIVALSF